MTQTASFLDEPAANLHGGSHTQGARPDTLQQLNNTTIVDEVALVEP